MFKLPSDLGVSVGGRNQDTEVITSRHNYKATNEFIKKLLADGTPDWIKWPEDYKHQAKEDYLREKETSDQLARNYQMDDQDILTFAPARKVNSIETREFIRRLRINNVRCFTIDNGYDNTVGLWAVIPGTDEVTYICYLQVPAMYEWSLLRLDQHGVPWGEEFRGWRTVLIQLIKKGILTEQKAHEIFGRPTGGVVSSRYRRSLWTMRNKTGIDRDIRPVF